MRHRGQTPARHRQRVSDACSQPIDQAANYQHAERVSSLKSEYEIAVINLAPAELVLQGILQDADHLAVHVVLGRAEQ